MPSACFKKEQNQIFLFPLTAPQVRGNTRTRGLALEAKRAG